MERRYLYIKEAAEYLSISEQALKRRVDRRTIPFVKDGRRLRFDIKAIEAYMEKRSVKASSDTNAAA